MSRKDDREIELYKGYATGSCSPLLYGALEAGTQVCRHAVGCDTPKVSEQFMLMK
jgi:hypothetical protein